MSETYEAGPLCVLPAEHLARADGRALMLSGRELRLLTALVREEDRIVRREDLFADVWGRAMDPRDRSVDVYIRKLRVKLSASLPDWTFIHTHFGLGYRFAAERHPLDTSRSHLVHTNGATGGHTRPRHHE